MGNILSGSVNSLQPNTCQAIFTSLTVHHGVDSI